MRRNFLHDIIDADREAGRYGGRVQTRFPPEPNGYLHIGHTKSINLNFSLAEDYGGTCRLRFDDTNPEAEKTEYVEAIQRDIEWLGYRPDTVEFASGYFEQLYAFAEDLVRKGLAYVCDLDVETIREQRGTLTEPGVESPYRGRSVAENLDLLARMRSGEFADGERVLRAKIDMSARNMLMRDPLLYRIRNVAHHRTGDAWHIYPMYDFAHCLSDAVEGVTHSICTLEFENNRELYDWLLEQVEVEAPPKQYEFARLAIGYTVMSKRILKALVEEGHVSGWDDPRMPTVAGMRRRGFTPGSLRAFAEAVGVTKNNSLIDFGRLEHAVRDALNHEAPRVMAVLDPLPVRISGLDEETLDASVWPHDVPREGTRALPLTSSVFIERDDFALEPPRGFKRLAPGRAVRLRHGPVIVCDEAVERDGEVVELRCSVAPDGTRPKGTIHWVPESAASVTVRLYDRLFGVELPGKARDFREDLNPDSLRTVEARVEPWLTSAGPGQHFQFERLGYFFTDPGESADGAPVFNRVVTLRDSWAKQAEAPGADADSPAGSGEKRAKEKKVRPRARTAAEIREAARAADPELRARQTRYRDDLDLGEDEADLLSGDRALSDLFDATVAAHADLDAVVKLFRNDVARIAKEQDIATLPVGGAALSLLLDRVSDGTISQSAARDVLDAIVTTGESADDAIARLGLKQMDDDAALEAVIARVVAAHPDKVARFRDGNQGMLGFFMGQVMRETGGKANPQKTNQLLRAALD